MSMQEITAGGFPFMRPATMVTQVLFIPHNDYKQQQNADNTSITEAL